MLLEFGVVTRLSYYDDGEVKVYIGNRRDGRLFHRRIGFWGVKQAKLARELSAIPETSRALSGDFVPFVAEYIRHAGGGRYASRDWLQRHNVDRVERRERDRQTIFAKIESDEVKIAVAPLVRGDYYYAEVSAVEPAGVQPVYSIRVESDCHSFITNGFVSHNTEARLSPVAAEMLTDLDHETVDMISNYDGRHLEPTVLPSKFPNLLVNGCDGIAVGMATDIPPHNLREVCDAAVLLIDNPQANLLESAPGAAGAGLPYRRDHLRPPGHFRRLRHRPRQDHPPRPRRDQRGRLAGADHHHRSAVPADAHPPGGVHRRVGQGRTHQGHSRHQGREQPAHRRAGAALSSTSSRAPTRSSS